MTPVAVLEQILDLARWAPSGDNAQPWRFQIQGEMQFIILGQDTRDHCLYDLDGRSTQLAIGAMIETAALAASRHGLRLEAQLRPMTDVSRPTFDVLLAAQPGMVGDPLWQAIPERSVHRRLLSRQAITETQWQVLRGAVGEDHELVHYDGKQRLSWASLLWANGGLRLRLPEGFETHRRAIDWGKRFSRTAIPDQALGVDAVTIAIMRRAMTSWNRVYFMNRWLAGTHMPRLLMDFLPSLACGAHIALMAKRPPASTADYVAGGRAVQRFWLAATQLGLQHQPAATPLVFARYLREGTSFTANGDETILARRLTVKLDRLLDGRTDRTVWLGRIGHGTASTSRSVRRPLSALMV